MERLTYNYEVCGNGCYQVKGADNKTCEEVCRQMEGKGCKDCPISKAIDKLAAYEETGLEPEAVGRILGRMNRLEAALTRIHDTVRMAR